LRKSLWTAIAEDDWAQADIDSAILEYVREAQGRQVPLAEICRSLRVHLQQVGLGLSADRYETIARHVTALAEMAHRGELHGMHSNRTVSLPGAGEES
jgi:hypothetical protein